MTFVCKKPNGVGEWRGAPRPLHPLVGREGAPVTTAPAACHPTVALSSADGSGGIRRAHVGPASRSDGVDRRAGGRWMGDGTVPRPHATTESPGTRRLRRASTSCGTRGPASAPSPLAGANDRATLTSVLEAWGGLCRRPDLLRRGLHAQRQASGAGSSGSEVRADAVSRRLHALVGHGVAPRDAWRFLPIFLLAPPSARPNVMLTGALQRVWCGDLLGVYRLGIFQIG